MVWIVTRFVILLKEDAGIIIEPSCLSEILVVVGKT